PDFVPENDKPIDLRDGKVLRRQPYYFRYSLYVRHPDYAQQRLPVTNFPTDYAQQRLPVTNFPTFFHIRLAPGGAIEARLIEEVTGEPASQVAVTLRSAGREEGDNWRQTQTDEQGRYRLTGLTPARYNAWASAQERTCVALESFPVVANETQKAPELRLIA